MLKERFKSNFQTRSKTGLCDSKTRTHEEQKYEMCKTNMKTYIYYC